jgi:hypothetical protein
MTREQIAEVIMNVTGANSVGELKRINVPADGLLQILDRLLCEGERDECPSASIPIPPYSAPPPSPSPDATERGGDRAAEIASSMVVAASDRGSIYFPPSRIKTYSDPVFDESRSATIRDLRAWLADALRVYGDELLARAARNTTLTVCSDKDCECDDCEAHRHDAQVICAMKPSAAKGAANE